VVNILVSSVTIVGYVLIPSPQDSWIWKSAAQTVNDKKYSAGPRYKIKGLLFPLSGEGVATPWVHKMVAERGFPQALPLKNCH